MSVLFACRTTGPSLPYHQVLVDDVGQFTIELPGPELALQQGLTQAIEHAGGPLSQWGKLEAPVTIEVLADHAELERVTGHHDASIRAFTTFDRLFLQSPATWPAGEGLPPGASQAQLDETVTHELTHALMFQLAAGPDTWSQKKIPFWFREGMATVTADQGYLFPSLEDVAREIDGHPEKDPIRNGGAVSRENFRLAYGAAFHAFRFLVDRYGKPRVRSLLARMKSGEGFEHAFEVELGLSESTFVKDFETYLRWRGFLPGRLNPPGRTTTPPTP